jgi:hypothetical protein
LFQHHRETSSWAWSGQSATHDLTIEGFPESPDQSASAVAICFHLSATISWDDLPAVSGAKIVDIRVPHPSVRWLVAKGQLDWLGETAGLVFERLSSAFPNCQRWHIFYAGPAPGGVKIGQQLNPTMCPEIQLYEFSKTSKVRYQPSMLLTAS